MRDGSTGAELGIVGVRKDAQNAKLGGICVCHIFTCCCLFLPPVYYMRRNSVQCQFIYHDEVLALLAKYRASV